MTDSICPSVYFEDDRPNFECDQLKLSIITNLLLNLKLPLNGAVIDFK